MMTLGQIKRNDIQDSDEAANIRRWLKQPCFTHTFSMETVGIVKDDGELVIIIKDLKNDPELSGRGDYVLCHFADSDAPFPYKAEAGLSLAE